MADGFSKFRKGIKLDPQATTPSNPEEGDIFRSDGSVLAKGVWEYRDGSWQTLGGSGQGGINYLEGDNTDFENGVGDWTEYADAAGTEPVDGTGGSATNHSFAQTGSTPLRGTASGLMSYATASSAQGEGVSCDFTIDEADKTQKLTISFDYDGSNSNYNDGDIRVFVYDVTNSNLIRVNGEDVKAGKGTHYAQFQAAADSTSYRLIMHIATSAVGLTQFKFDNVSVGPTKLAMGAIITDWIDFTPTGSFTTNSTYTGKWRRIGDSVELEMNITLSGAPNSTTLEFHVPSFAPVDESKTTGSFRGYHRGLVTVYDVSGGDIYQGTAILQTATTIRPQIYIDISTHEQQDNIDQVSPVTLANADEITVHITYPVQGWSSNAAMSEDLGGRDVVVRGAGNGGESITANVTDIPFTEVEDTTSSWDGDSFTTPETGYYIISGNIRATASISSSNVQLYVDRGSGAALEKTIGYSDGVQYTVFSGNVYLEKGDVATIRSSDNITLQNSTTVHTIHIQKVGTSSEAATVGGRRDVVAEGAGNGGGAITANVTDIDFTETRDTSDSFDGTIFTAPESGDYDFNGFIRFTAGVSAAIYNYIDGVQDKRVGTAGASSSSHEINGSVYLEKGQQLSFRSNVGATLNNVTTDHHIHIQKLNSGKTALETETVAARYEDDSGQTINSTTSTLTWNTTYADTHNALSSGVYTVPVSGWYDIDAFITTTSVNLSTSQRLLIRINIDSGTKIINGDNTYGNGTARNYTAHVASKIELSKDQTVEIQAFSDVSDTLNTSTNGNYFSIARIK
jgi:hypothetical protein